MSDLHYGALERAERQRGTRIEIDRAQAVWFAAYIQDSFVKGSTWEGLSPAEKEKRLAKIEAGLARIGVDVEWPDQTQVPTKSLEQVRAELDAQP